MAEDSGVSIADSVVMGDVQQNITNVQQHISSTNICPRCEAINVRVVRCSMPKCDNQFCELCHPFCRWTPDGVGRLDSGLGKGPFCGLCMEVQLEQWENEEIEEHIIREMSVDRIIAIIGLILVGILFVLLPSQASFPFRNYCLGIFALIELVMVAKFLVSRRAYHRLIS